MDLVNELFGEYYRILYFAALLYITTWPKVQKNGHMTKLSPVK